jgi:hypothetical protein
MDSTPANQPVDDVWQNEYKDRLPPTLNVLTILTIIWNAFSILSLFGSFALAPFGYRNAINNQDAIDNMPPIVKSLLGNTREAARLAYENRVPILLIGLLGVALCFIGALQMRRRKRSGFVLYILGDLAPIASLLFTTVASTFAGITIAFGYGIALLFVILYATQLKYLK